MTERPRPGQPIAATRQRITALVAVYAILAQVLLGTLAAAFGPSRAAPGLPDGASALASLAQLCTPDGLVRVAYPDADQQGNVPPRPDTPKCPFCLAGGHVVAFAPSGAWVLDPPGEAVAADWRQSASPAARSLRFTEVRPRGPPATA